MSSKDSNPEECHIFAILYPAEGKSDRLKELMTTMIKNVHEKEDYTTRYIMTEQQDADGTPAIHMFETYKSKGDADTHTKTQHFKDLMAACDKDGVMGKAPYLVFTKTVQGFDLDRKLAKH